MWTEINHVGQAGPPLMALSVIDTALWDLGARSAGLPLHQLLGGKTTRFPLYGSGGWLSYSLDELLEEAQFFAAAGYCAYKMKVGNTVWREDLERVSKVIDAVGDRIEIMVDVNQSWFSGDAVPRITTLLDLGVRWIEEPVDANDLRGISWIRTHSVARLAAGETLTLAGCIERLILPHSVDVVMPDLMRCGGPTGMSDVMSIARHEHVQVSPHLFPEVSVHVASAFVGEVMLEDIVGGWAESCFDSTSNRSNGVLDISHSIGIGLKLREDLEIASRIQLAG